MLNPNIRRNFISFVYSVVEHCIRAKPEEYLDEFMSLLKLCLEDLTNQAEQSLNKNDPVFLQNFLKCYMNIPDMILLYLDNTDVVDNTIDLINQQFSNSKLSIFQLHVIFTVISKLARGRNLTSEHTAFATIETSSKKFVLTI